ncbi:MAG: sensor histidine kinase [Acetatifactor sp.]|nr:sensor histidine kinase [Acetatifactor sp.]
MSSERNEINDILDEFNQECEELTKNILEREQKVKEIDAYVESLLSREDDDFKIFSPRNVESIYHERIEQSRLEKEELQGELKDLYHKRNIISDRINKLSEISPSDIQEKSFSMSSSSENPSLSILILQEKDRQRIASELHDTSLQDLAYLIHKIELSRLFIDQDPIRAKLELSVVEEKLRSIIGDIRNTIYDLRPMTFDDLGFKAAVERLLEEASEKNGLKTVSDIDEITCSDNIVLVTLFRILQECINNVVKHANAQTIVLKCKKIDGFCHVEVNDDGEGFTDDKAADQPDKHFGMTVMRERVNLLGGKIMIDSEAGSGTSIKIQVPLNN